MKKLVLTMFLALGATACGGPETDYDPAFDDSEFGQTESAVSYSAATSSRLQPQCTCVQDSQCPGGRCVANCTPGQAWGTCVYPGGGGDPTLDEENFTSRGSTDGQRRSVREIKADTGVSEFGVACGCDPTKATACGRGQYCRVGGCTNPTSSKWGYCKSSGGSGVGPTDGEPVFTSNPGRGDP